MINLFDRRRPSTSGDLAQRLAALEEYVEYLRQQGEYGFLLAGDRLTALERKLTADRADS